MRESIRRDRARIQVGRISNFGLLEMTRQRLREGSIKWETNLSLESFSQKILKKIQLLAFNSKIKIINALVPNKVKDYINSFLSNEIKYFETRYPYKINLVGESNFIIPDYKIELLNKSKKVLNTIENIKKIPVLQKTKKENSQVKRKKIMKKKVKVIKTRQDKKVKTLWVRKKLAKLTLRKGGCGAI